MAKLTGKASYFKYKGTTISVVSYKPKVARTIADTTDTASYDSGSDMIQPTGIPVMVAMELSIDGKYDKATVSPLLVLDLYSSVAAVAVVLGLDAGAVFGHGNFDLTDFEVTAVYNDTVTFTCTLKQNGVFTPGS